jgi:ABC-type multidrug transport system ATPase subunit
LNVIDARDIQKRFGKIVALDNVGFRLGSGEVLILLGPNGAGKSTLLKILASLYRPSNGSVRLFGQDPLDKRSRIRNMTSFLGENYALYDDLTVRKNLQFFGRLYDISDKALDTRMRYWLKRFDAMQYIDRDVGELSRGTKQKIALCRALINQPRLLLLDEPSAFLDPAASRMLHSELNALSRSGVSIVYATQRLDELYKIGDRVLLLRNGRVMALGSIEKVINTLGDVEVEILTSKPISRGAIAALSRRWKLRHGDSEKSLIFSLGRINDIPKVVRDVVKNDGEIIGVLYLKESIDRILRGA